MMAQDVEVRCPKSHRDARIRRAVRLIQVLIVIVAIVVVAVRITGTSVPDSAYWFAVVLGFASWLLVRSLPARPRHDYHCR